MKALLILLIKSYRFIYHPIKQGFRDAGIELNKCQYTPTCSEYAVLALNKYPLITALKKICNRLKRCSYTTHNQIDYP